MGRNKRTKGESSLFSLSSLVRDRLITRERRDTGTGAEQSGFNK
jgi:hypothetical protein